MSNGAIAVFDSGVGGASILFECKKLMPDENFIYIADNLKSPYGKKSKEFILARVSELFTMLVKEHNIKAFVIACNTASFIVKDKLRKKFSIPIFAVEPPIKTFLTESSESKAMLLATGHTLNSQKIKEILHIHENITPVYLPDLAKMVDKFSSSFEIAEYLKTNLSKLKTPDAIILGCTHYHFIKKELKKVFPKARIYSCETSVAKYIKEILVKENLLSENLDNASLNIILTKPDKVLYDFILRNFK